MPPQPIIFLFSPSSSNEAGSFLGVPIYSSLYFQPPLALQTLLTPPDTHLSNLSLRNHMNFQPTPPAFLFFPSFSSTYNDLACFFIVPRLPRSRQHFAYAVSVSPIFLTPCVSPASQPPTSPNHVNTNLPKPQSRDLNCHLLDTCSASSGQQRHVTNPEVSPSPLQ